MSGRSDILRHLEPAAPPAAAIRAATSPRRSLEEADFRTLIATAQDDFARTNRPVNVPGDIALTPGQHSRLERAADAALAHDSRTALVMLDGRPLLLDVQSREVREEIRADGKSDRIMTDIDTVIISKDEKSADGKPSSQLMLRRLSAGAGPAAVAAVIDREERGSSPAATHDIGN